MQTDLGLAVVKPIIWQQTELLWSIAAASVPCLKTFMRPFDNIDEDTWRSNNDMYASQRSGGLRRWRDPRDGSVPLEDMKSHKRGMVLSTEAFAGGERIYTRPDRIGHDVVVSRNSGYDPDSDQERRRSWGSQDWIIKTERHWEVRTERSPKDPYEIP